jgi:hypothetical protein
MKELAQLPVAVDSLTWSCLCTPESRATLGCPHVYGGPANLFGDGWFSECVQYSDITVADRGIDLDDNSLEPSRLADECS